MKAEITDLGILREVEVELKRFTKTLKNAIKEKEENQWNAKGFASAKRGAMDLKNELTKLTQSSRYKYEDKFLK